MVPVEVAFHRLGREQRRTIGDAHDGSTHIHITHMMEDHMTDFMHAAAEVTPRRGFFARMAGAMALGLAGFAATPSAMGNAPWRNTSTAVVFDGSLGAMKV